MAKDERRIDWNSVMGARDEMLQAASPHETTIWHPDLGWHAFAERLQTKVESRHYGAPIIDWIDKHDRELPDYLLVAADAIGGLKHILDTGRVPDYYQQSSGAVEDLLRDSAQIFRSAARRSQPASRPAK